MGLPGKASDAHISEISVTAALSSDALRKLGRLLHGRVEAQYPFNFSRVNIFTAADNEIAFAPHQPVKTLGVDVSQIAGMVPAFRRLVDGNFLVVVFSNGWPSGTSLARNARRHTGIHAGLWIGLAIIPL